MERVGLVSQVEAELENMLSLELLPENRGLPSEHKLARIFGVSRGTVREALLRLATKGLIVQHPGRRTHAVPLDEAVTLENLSVLLDGDGLLQGNRWRLLESFFALKRDLMVELLAAACEKASPEDLKQLERACYALGEDAHWDEGERRWVPQEFALLRLAASATERFGHVLLVQSLQRAFRGMAHWVLPHRASKSVRPWTICAMNALSERDAQTLRQQLPPLLQACDERLLQSLERAHQPPCTHEPHLTKVAPSPASPSMPEPASEELPEHAAPCDAQLLRPETPPPPIPADDEQQLHSLAPDHQPVPACEPHPTWIEPPTAAPSTPEPAEGGLSGEVVTNLSNSRTGSWTLRPTGGSPPESVSGGPCHGPPFAEPEENRPPGLEGSPGSDTAVPPGHPRETRGEPHPCSQSAGGHACTKPSCDSG